ncbi:hypothetical protein [Roseimaritima ulvae]|uniref:hypothetical protein n=1 Tax=Roseimaritima ulvae TaxID=980254 RepID=UPI0008341C4F|nr:hypothetical protein [Roseimaritima ulvae]
MSLHSPIGSHPTYEEYQVDSTIVSIRIPTDGARYEWITKGNAMFDDAWRLRRDVIAAAEKHSRAAHTKFWSRIDDRPSQTQVFDIRGIWIDPKSKRVTYDVYDVFTDSTANDGGVALPDEYAIDVELDSTGSISVLE